MEILKYRKSNHAQIIKDLTKALKAGKVVAYPTDTSYGLAIDTANEDALLRLYKIKERNRKQPIHVVVPNIKYAKEKLRWSPLAEKLSKKFFPGPLTLVLELKAGNPKLWRLTGGSGFLGMRMPKNKIALDLAKNLGRPITTTSANPSKVVSGGADSYSAQSIIRQFAEKKYKPDVILDAGKLPKQKPSTIVKIHKAKMEILREGPIDLKNNA